MGNRKKPSGQFRPATTLEGREGQLVSLAQDLAERQMRDGSASAQVVTHFLRLGSTTAKLEQERLRNENLLLSAKIGALKSQERVEELFENAINAMRAYSGQDYDDEDEYYAS